MINGRQGLHHNKISILQKLIPEKFSVKTFCWIRYNFGLASSKPMSEFSVLFVWLVLVPPQNFPSMPTQMCCVFAEKSAIARRILLEFDTSVAIAASGLRTHLLLQEHPLLDIPHPMFPRAYTPAGSYYENNSENILLRNSEMEFSKQTIPKQFIGDRDRGVKSPKKN